MCPTVQVKHFNQCGFSKLSGCAESSVLTIVTGGVDYAGTADHVVSISALSTACSRPVAAQTVLLTSAKHNMQITHMHE